MSYFDINKYIKISNIIEFNNKYFWIRCNFGYSKIKNGKMIKDCYRTIEDDSEECYSCKLYEYYNSCKHINIIFDGCIEHVDFTVKNYNYCYILKIGIIL